MSHRQHSLQMDAAEYTISSPVIPADNTVPTSSEGVEIFSKDFTPTETDSIINLEFGFTASAPSFNLTMTVAFFEGATCIGVVPFSRGTNDMKRGTARIRVAASTTTERTYSVRIAPEAQTLYLNRTDTAGEGLGGAEFMWFEIDEVAP